MDDWTLHLTILLLAGLAYALVTATLYTLASRVRQQRHRHDLIRHARQRRRQYIETLAQRRRPGREAAAAHDDDVDIIAEVEAA